MDSMKVKCENVNCAVEKVILVFVDLFLMIANDLNENSQVKVISLESEELKRKIRNSLMKILANQKIANFLLKFQSFYELKTNIGRDIINIHDILLTLSNHQVHKIFQIIKCIALMNENETEDKTPGHQHELNIQDSSRKFTSPVNIQSDRVSLAKGAKKEETCNKNREIKQEANDMTFLGRKKKKPDKDDTPGEVESKKHMDEITVTSTSTRPTKAEKQITLCEEKITPTPTKINDYDSVTYSLIPTNHDKIRDMDPQNGLLFARSELQESNRRYEYETNARNKLKAYAKFFEI